MIQIKLLKDWQSKKAGDIINISKKGGISAVESRVAEYYDNEKKHKASKDKIDNPFKAMADVVLDSIEKYGEINEDGNVYIDSGLQRQLIGKVKENNIKDLITSYFDKSDLAKQILKIQPMFYDENKLWWVWIKGEYKWEIKDETDILNFVNVLSTANTVNSKHRNEILESLKQTSRKWKPLPIKETWIQFKDLIIDIKTGEEIQATSKYFVTNPISYSLNKERYVNAPIMDKIFEEWVGKEYVQTLYEVIAYSLIPYYPLHRIFCFIGGGMNGKSCFLNLLKKFIGKNNCCSTELDSLLNSRFEVTRLHKKLICLMGETNFNEINKTSILKKLSGGDLIGFEYKNKNPFEEVNYAKIIIATNNLPTTTDKTVGFYRRWLIIDFPNQFSEKKDILAEIPEEEYEILAVKCLGILKDLLDKKEFHNEGDIEDRKEKYESRSNFLESFIKEYTIEDLNSYITKSNFFKKFTAWCKENRHREMSETSIGLTMKKIGIESDRRHFDWLFDGKGGQARVFIGIKWKEN